MSLTSMCCHNKPFISIPHLEFSFSEQCAELDDALCCDVTALWPVLGHLVLQGDEADGGALLFLQAEELQDALVVVHVAVDENEQDLDRGEGRGSVFVFTDHSKQVLRLKMCVYCILNACHSHLTWYH